MKKRNERSWMYGSGERASACLVWLTVFSIGILGGQSYGKAAQSVEKGHDVGDGIVRYDCPYNPKAVNDIAFVAPSIEYPYYEIVVPMGDWTQGKSATVDSVVVNGVTSESFYVFVDGRSHVSSAWITRKAATAENVVLVTRSLWHNGEDTTVEIGIKATNNEDSPETVTKTFSGKAPSKGGGPSGWRRYQSFVAREKAGLDRRNEPVEFTLAARAENCGDLERELRLFHFDTSDSSLEPVPFQTFNAKAFPGNPPGTVDPNYLKHPSRSIQVVFPASVRANSAKVYVAFYDNPDAEAVEEPETDLDISGPSLGATVENWFYKVKLSEKSGQIASFDLKPGNWGSAPELSESGVTSSKNPDADPAWKDLQTPRLSNSLSLALHWNPDSFGDNGKWGHTFAWNPPDRTVVTARGPLLFRITNSGRMPDETPQIDASVSYSFYPGVPYVMATTITKARDPFNASAIRNGEIVLDSHLVTHFVWKEKNGEVRTVRTVHGPNWQDEWVYRVDQDVPWIALTNELDGFGVGEAILSSIAFNPVDGEATQHRPAFYLYYHPNWQIPLTYFTRGWVYPFSDYQRGPILPVDAGSTYVERMAFVPFPLHDSNDRYREIQEVSLRLQDPLEIRWGR